MPSFPKLGRRGRAGSADLPEGDVVTKVGGKGRPTPTRREAIAARPVTPYMKGGGSRARATGRAGRREDAVARRAAMERGELPRDRGPERALARDLVDSRRSPLTLLVWFAAASFLFGLVPALAAAGAVLSAAFALVAIVEGFLLTRLVRRRVRAELPDATRPVRFYAVQRAVSPRRIRVPKPRVERGDPV